MYNIFFHELNIKSSLLYRNDLKKFLFTLFKTERKTLKRVDKYFLNHDYNTDTLSFLLSDVSQPIIGELYLSVERININAKDLNYTYQEELLRVIIHSCLHLCGYEDIPKSSAIEIEKKQEIYLSQWLFHVKPKRRG